MTIETNVSRWQSFNMALYPLCSLLKTIQHAIAGRCTWRRVGQTLSLDSQSFRIFRHVTVAPGPGQPHEPGAIFPAFPRGWHAAPAEHPLFAPADPVLYRPAGLSIQAVARGRVNRRLAGYYEWNTAQDAENYSRSPRNS
jgi:hypothetical protein